MSFLPHWDKEEKASYFRTLGLFTAALTVFLFLSCISYLFTWKQDMSLLSEPEGEVVANTAGRLGFKTAYFLICELFGLGSFFLIVILWAFTMRLLFHAWKTSIFRTILKSLFGAFVFSILFSYFGKLFDLEHLFGGGLGGYCGLTVVQWGEDLFGVPVSGLFSIILLAAFMILSSKRFNHWFATLGDGSVAKKKKKTKVVEEPEVMESEVEEIESEEDDLTIANIEPKANTEASNTELKPNTEQESRIVEPESQEKEEAEGSFEIISDESLNQEVTQELKPIDNRLDPPEGLPKYSFPSLDLLKDYKSGRREVSTEELTRNNNKIRATLANYKIQVTDVKAVVGPTVTLYKVIPAPGVKISEIKKLQEDIAVSLKAKGVRVTTLLDAVGIEVANDYSSIVPLKALLNDTAFRDSQAELPVAIGYTITQKVKVFDLADAPHLLIAGATKQGKSVGVNVIVSSLLYSKHPSELKFVFIDPKTVEFSSYKSLYRHFIAMLPDAASEEDEIESSIIKTAKNADKVLKSLCIEMDERYELLNKGGVNKITLYNQKYKERKLNPEKGHKFLPYIVAVIDEYADLTLTTGGTPEARTTSRSITNSIIRLAQKGRAAGMHVILATQRPSVDVISGVIKSNFPMRIAFRVVSRTDSMTILDTPGAERLIGSGDMLFSASIDTERVQCALIDGEETDAITNFIWKQNKHGQCYNTPYYLPVPESETSEGSGGSLNANSLDERFEEAARLVVSTQRGSTSDLQRKLGMGYAKSGRIMDQLEMAGIVGPQDGSKPRTVLISDMDTLEELLATLKK